MPRSFSARLKACCVEATDNPFLAIDLDKTFLEQSREESQCAEFYFIDGSQDEYSWRIWELGYEAYMCLLMNWPNPNIYLHQYTACVYLEAVLEKLNKFKSFLVSQAIAGGEFRIFSDEGRDLDADEVEELFLLDIVFWLISLPGNSRIPKEHRIDSKSILAILALYSLNMLHLGRERFYDHPDWLVEIYADARDILAGNQMIDAVTRNATSSAKAAAGARHKESNELKQEALQYYAEHRHRFRNRTVAAEAISRQIPIKFRTIYGWLAAADKAED